jgi:hypothetical protein
MNIVITTIFEPTLATRTISERLEGTGGALWLVGDSKGPFSCSLPNTRFFDIHQQRKLGFLLAAPLPEKHYARKNLGYLLAIQAGAPFIVETDDDNIPLEAFWSGRQPNLTARLVSKKGWCNAYNYFSDSGVWPRGLPLNHVLSSPGTEELPMTGVESLILQGLADDNPDVDAIYRMTRPLPLRFDQREPLALGPGVWCPFNSQNTTFFPEAFPLLYLPSFCTFRMTDIWRSFVAQRCLWAMDSVLSFTSASVRQERNEHNLMRDFEDEIPGYLHNARIAETLEALELRPGRDVETVTANLAACYEALILAGFFPKDEARLLSLWRKDILALARR